MSTKLLILGGGVYQLPLIQRANQLGITTVVVSPFGPYPGIEAAKVHVNLDTTDEEGVLAVAQQHSVDGVITIGSDVSVRSVGRVVDALKLSGTGYAAAALASDKVRMKDALTNYGVPTARFSAFRTVDEARTFARIIGYPCMVKAPDSSGSRGVVKVEKESEFDGAFREAMSVSRSEEVIVETFLDGIEFGAQAFIVNGEVVRVYLHGDTVTSAPYYTPIGHSMPIQLSAAARRRAKEVIHAAVKSIGLNNTVANVDLMQVGEEVYIIEIGARIGATCLPENISVYDNFDIYQYLIELALNRAPKLPQGSSQANASRLICATRNGILQAIEIPSVVQNDADLVQLQLDVAPGDRVRAFRVGPDRIGHLVVRGPSAGEAEKKAEEMIKLIRIQVSDETN